MNKIFLGLFILSQSVVLCQNDTIWYNTDWYITLKSDALYFRPPVTKSENGYMVKDYYISGILQMEGNSMYSDRDYWDGEVKYYFEDGSLEGIINYSDNDRDGKIEMYHPNGQPYYVGYFVNGKKDKNWVVYSENGNKICAYSLKDYRLDGHYAAWNEDGVLKHEGEFVEGEMKWFKNFECNNGFAIASRMEGIMDENGIQHWKVYRNDILIVESYYKDYYRYGTWKTYSLDGKKLHSISNFTNLYDCDINIDIIEWTWAEPLHYLPDQYTDTIKHVAVSNSSKSDTGCMDGTFEHYDIYGNLYKTSFFEKGEYVGQKYVHEGKAVDSEIHPLFQSE